jgi:hypothetical protein
VCSSFGFTPTATSDKLVPDQNGDLHVVDEYGVKRLFPKDRFGVKIGFEGVVIRIFKHGGKVYRCTHRRLNPASSRWGNSPTFPELYKRVGGPSDEELFEPEADYSPWCYVFLLVDTSLLCGTKQDVGPGYMVLLSRTQMWSTDPELCPYAGEPIEVQSQPTFVASREMPRVIESSFIYESRDLTLEEANRHLAFGYYEPFEVSDPRLRSGEFLVLYRYDEQGRTQELLKVQSSSYEWRYVTRDDQPNLTRRFFGLATLARQDIPPGPEGDLAYQSYVERFPLFPSSYRKSLPSLFSTDGPFVYLPGGGNRRDLSRYENRLINIWVAFVVSLPLALQEKALGLLDAYKQDLKMLDERLVSYSRTYNSKSESSDSWPSAWRVIDVAKARTRDIVSSRRPNDRERRGLTFSKVLDQEIKAELARTKGYDLYRLIKELRSPRHVDGQKREEQAL